MKSIGLLGLFFTAAHVHGRHLPINSTNISGFWEDFETYKTNEDLKEVWHSSEAVEEHGRKLFPASWKLFHNPDYVESNRKGLLVKSPGKYAMIGRNIEKPVNVSDSELLVIQYEVKSTKDPHCEGAFIKLFHNMYLESLTNYDRKAGVKYDLLFGPDFCLPDTNMVRFEWRNRKDKEEKKLVFSPKSKLNDGQHKNHLYTMILDLGNKILEIRIDGKVVLATSLNDSQHFKDTKYMSTTDTHEDSSEFNFSIDGLTFDIWGTLSGIVFKNVYIGNSIEEAEIIGNNTYLPNALKENDLILKKLKVKNDGKVPNAKSPYDDNIYSQNLFDILFDKLVGLLEGLSIKHMITVLLVLIPYMLYYLARNHEMKKRIRTEDIVEINK
ncbi:Calreticulin family [Nakaseomyces glabratus]|nr:hypothetical protein LTX96_0005023 [Nakaseomyces glabratus]